MTKRKSPVHHGVSGYTRKDGSKVRPYARGRGTRSKTSRRVVKAVDEDTRMEELAFTVNFKYSDKPDDGESVIVIADTYQRALEEAFEEKVDTRMPIEVDMVDPDLDAILKFVGEGARKIGAKVKEKAVAAAPRVRAAAAKAGKYALVKIEKGAKVGAKYAMRGGHVAAQAGVAVTKGVVRGVAVGLKESSKLALYEIERSKVRRLIKQAYSKDPIERRSARIAIKRVYPDIYDICHFSKDRPLSRRKAPDVVRLPKRLRSQAVV